MKMNRIILPLLAGTMLLAGCYDEKMEWGTPEGHGYVASDEIPLALKEKIANYDYLKNYMAQYMPNVPLGIGLGASKYLSDDAYAAVCDANFQQFVTGNAMKHQSMVNNDGTLKIGPDSELEQFITKMSGKGIDLFGHNLIWHTQQNLTYLKSLIGPVITVETDGDIASILSNGDFETGDKTNWSSWGGTSTSTVKAGIGVDGSYGLELVNPEDGSDYYTAQLAYTLNSPLEVGKTYLLRFKAKSLNGASSLQFATQNSSDYSGEGYKAVDVGTDWTTCEVEYTCTKSGLNRVLINFGKIAGTYILDDIEFGEKIEDTMLNVLAGDDSDFDGGTSGKWGSWGSGKDDMSVQDGVGRDGSACVALKNVGDGNFWDAQFGYTFDTPLKAGTTYQIQFYAKATSAAGELQFQYQNGTTYGSQGGYHSFPVGTDWTLCEYEFTTEYDDVNRIILNFGKVGGTYYIDNIKFGEKKTAASSARKRAATRASKITYTFKTAEEKRTILLGAMDSWIKGINEAVASIGVKEWDVVNEPITDGSYQWRGVGGNFSSGTNDDGTAWADTEPVEDPNTGFNIDWQDGHFYWGYYLGKDYAVEAFKLARKYAPADCRLYVNDYNLESSPGKLAALIDFVNYVDNHGGQVDGIGTQMHISYDIDSTAVAEMFKTMAATGKMVRVSELDVKLNTATPSAEQMQQQSDCYRMVINAYKACVPEAQRGGFTIWGLSDAADEHTYWIPNDAPNIFDSTYARKTAYKGLCDGIAGKDISAGFTGDMWPNAYE